MRVGNTGSIQSCFQLRQILHAKGDMTVTPAMRRSLQPGFRIRQQHQVYLLARRNVVPRAVETHLRAIGGELQTQHAFIEGTCFDQIARQKRNVVDAGDHYALTGTTLLAASLARALASSVSRPVASATPMRRA